jgi:hypothetical protein
MSRDEAERWSAIEGAVSAHSPLFEWMLRHHVRLGNLFAGKRVSWKALARQLAQEGLVDKKGQPPKPETLRKSWQRVRQHVAARRAAAEARVTEQAAAPAKPAKPEPDLANYWDAMKGRIGTKLPEPEPSGWLSGMLGKGRKG